MDDPFDIDLAGVEDREAIATPDEEVITAALAFALRWAVGIPVITEGNAPEVYARMRMLELLGGPMFWEETGPRFITPADVRRRIGMRVSGGKTIERPRFLRHVGEGWLGEYRSAYSSPQEVRLH